MIPQDTVDQILAAAHIEDVISEFINLKRRGVNMIGVCPFHDEKTPSFIVSPAKGIYKCFGCGNAGNVTKFVMEHESIGYYEALKYLANKYNIEIVERDMSPEERQAKQLSESLYILNDFAYQYFDHQLFHSDLGRSVGLSYFKERGYIEATIKKWNLGYTSEPNGFINHATRNQYNKELLTQSGLITRNGGDFFRERVMFAIHNLSGKIVAFAGRTLSKDKTQPKYINSPETEIYEKRKTLFGIHLAKTPIRREDNCYLVEGYTDVITLSQGGVENVVASSGTALTASQVRLVKRFTQNITVIYDGDNAGIMAALRGLDIILEQDMNVRLVLLPDGEDPDSYLKKVGSDEFKKYVDQQAKDFILFKTNLLLKDAAGDPIKKGKVIRDIVDSIAKVPNPVTKQDYIAICANLLDVEEQLLSLEVSKATEKIKEENHREQRRQKDQAQQQNFEDVHIITENNSPPVQSKPKQEDATNNLVFKDNYQERDLIRILVTGGDKLFDKDKNITVSQYLIHNLADSIDQFDNPIYKDMLLMAIDALNHGMQVNSHLYTNNPNPEIQYTAIELATVPYTFANWEERGIYLQTQKKPDENFQSDCVKAILRFKLRKANRQIDEISSYLLSLKTEEERILYIKILQTLQKTKNMLMAELKQIV